MNTGLEHLREPGGAGRAARRPGVAPPRAWRWPALVWLGAALLLIAPARAATHLVRMGNYFFNPTNLVIQAGDTVVWSNTVVTPHDSTHAPGSGPPLWASATFQRPNTFSFTFTNAGFYPYVCLVHIATRPQQTGTVTVLAPNQFPSVTLTSPTNGAAFVEPATFPVTAAASDPDGSVTNVLFLVNGAAAGQSAGPVFSTTLSGLAAGSYTLRAVATDNAGASVTSAPVAVMVQAPPRYQVVVNVLPPPGGTVTLEPSPPPGGYQAGATVTLTPLAAPGYFFQGWTGDVVSASAPLVLTISNDVAVAAVFGPVPRTLTLVADPPDGGAVLAEPPPDGRTGTYPHGTVVTLTAVPDLAFAFAGWSADAAGTNPVVTLVMTNDLTATAQFAPRPVVFLSVSNEPAPGGGVLVVPGPNAPGGGYYAGTPLTLTAQAAGGFFFTNWSGALASVENPLSFTITSNALFVARFAAETAPPRLLTLTANPPEGAALLRASPAPNGPGGTYVDGTLVTVEAVPAAGYSFSHWTGATNDSTNPVTVLMDADRALTAHFTLIPRYILGITLEPVNGGAVLLDPPPNAPGGMYLEGTAVLLTAMPAERFAFKGFTGDVVATNGVSNVVVLVRSNTAVLARFVPLYALETRADPANLGFVLVRTPPPAGTGGLYEEGAEVSLEARPFAGNVFTGWTGDIFSTALVVTVRMDTNRLAIAGFFRPPVAYTLALNTNPAGAGGVLVSPAPRPDGTYGGGVEITLRAVPDEGFRFGEWLGHVPPGSVEPVLTFTTEPDPVLPVQTLDITASFVPRPVVDFTNAAGTYAGLLRSEPPDFNASGYFSLRLRQNGSFKGTAYIGAGRSALAGRFNRFGDATITLRRGSLRGVLLLDTAAGGISGSLTDGRQTAALQLWRALGQATATRPATYDVTLAPTAPVTSPGTARVTVTPDGRVKVRGTLGDGTSWSSDTFVTVRDSVEVYDRLYRRRGAVLGVVDAPDEAGALEWFRPEDSRSRAYPDGFRLTVPVTLPTSVR